MPSITYAKASAPKRKKGKKPRRLLRSEDGKKKKGQSQKERSSRNRFLLRDRLEGGGRKRRCPLFGQWKGETAASPGHCKEEKASLSFCRDQEGKRNREKEKADHARLHIADGIEREEENRFFLLTE